MRDESRPYRWLGLAIVLAVLATGCPGEDDDGGGELTCDRRDQAFETFVAANRSCVADTDCRIIGDCGPNADFRAVSADAASEASALMDARCVENYDGPTYRAVCDDGTCSAVFDGGMCGGLPDFGRDADDAGDMLDAADGDDGDGDDAEGDSEGDLTHDDAGDGDADDAGLDASDDAADDAGDAASDSDAADDAGDEGDTVDAADDTTLDGDLSALEAACTTTGGTVTTASCCEATDAFPDLCSVGACGCAPEFSVDTPICDCGTGRCFDGSACVDL